MSHRAIALIGFLVLIGTARPTAAGTVTGVSLSTRTIVTGTAISVTVTGSNPCGAAHIIYGDGAAITYAITGLPTTQTHVYDTPGKYTITARGMGNCDGEATTTLSVTRPEEPPAQPAAPPPAISEVKFTPATARVREPVTITVRGSGVCPYDVTYGDGAADQVSGRLPQDTRHTYAKPGTYTVVVKPQAPCVGKFTELLQVTDGAAQAPRITRIHVAPAPATAGEPVAITIEGTGTCAFTIDYGDGNWESRSIALPDAVRHVYPRSGVYTVLAIADAPCAGSGRRTFRVARR